MESKEPLQNKEESANHATNRFLKIKNIKVFSKAYYLRLKEGDIIIGLNGDNFNSTYDELKNILENDEKDKVLTILRDETYFNVTVNSSLGIQCEEIDEIHIKNYKSKKKTMYPYYYSVKINQILYH